MMNWNIDPRTGNVVDDEDFEWMKFGPLTDEDGNPINNEDDCDE